MSTNNIAAYLKFCLSCLLLLGFTSYVQAQEVKAPKLSRQKLSFTLFDKTGQPVTEEALKAGQVKVYSLRETTAASFPSLAFDAETKIFTFSEPVISSGIALAFVTPTETMFVTVYGRINDSRVVDGIKLHKGSYIITSNDFAGRKELKVENWDKYLEDETPPAKQDLSSYVASLKGKTAISVTKPTE